MKSKILFCLIGLNFMLLGCNGHGSRGNLTGTRAQTGGRIIVLVDERFKDQSFARLESHLKRGAGHAKQIICTRITTSQNKEEHLRELTSMHNRAVILNEYILQAIERNGWDKKQDEFVLLGYSEQGIAALEAAETLRHAINLTQVAS